MTIRPSGVCAVMARRTPGTCTNQLVASQRRKRPASIGSRRLMHRSNVDLPESDAPIRHNA